ncbi:hypothetical protein PQO03_18750 [Lentisphaera profundi]|uniref:GAF domain-containing protein n=1 Tax=Lentisphaera profundi TaxID=1658616 RepID=A0ABY7VX71_9BACT|nr:hypothetical protein [Lentisphaera profundi]WDE97868.1 hypothetical protein PQO03_18750 [Lentisphaera profundi]
MDCYSAEDIFSLSADTILLMTGLERAYGFLIENNNEEMNLREIIAKNSNFLPIKEKNFTISQSIVNKVLDNQNSVYISNADSNNNKSQSMFDFDIKTVICIPLSHTNEKLEKKLIGILYIDKQYSSHPLPSKLETSLKTIASMTANSILSIKNPSLAKMTPEFRQKYQFINSEIHNIKSTLSTSSKLINKFDYGNPSALKTILRECRKDLMRLTRTISPPIQHTTSKSIEEQTSHF